MDRSMKSRGGGTAGEGGYPRVTPGQSELPFPDEHALRQVGEHIDAVYQALRDAVEEFGGTVAFAAAAEVPVSKMSVRLRRADDERGRPERAHLDILGVLAADQNARAVFLTRLAEAWGFLPPTPARPLTDAERAAILSEAVADKTKRAIETQRGLPRGSLG